LGYASERSPSLDVGVLLPLAWAGVWVGNRVHVRLASATMARVVGAVLFLAGATLIFRAF